MSATILKVRITKSGEGYKGTANIPGLRPAVLARTSDDMTVFATKSGLTQSAKSLAKRLGSELEFDDATLPKTKAKATTRSRVNSPAAAITTEG